jgi:hypothetical protein
MAGNLGRLTNQYYQASGESTPQAQLPEKFVSHPVATSPVSDHLTVAYESYHDLRRAPIVTRAPRMNGYRTLYSRGMSSQPIKRLGADGQPFPWNSAANRHDQGPIRNGLFNDALFQAGYPGFNLGLSFKVQSLPTQSAQTTRPAVQAPAMINIARKPPLG